MSYGLYNLYRIENIRATTGRVLGVHKCHLSSGRNRRRTRQNAKVNKIEYVDDLGVTTHKGNNYYSPAFSKIFIDERRDSDIYEQDRYFVYKEIPENDRIDFARWSHLMNDVYSINDNGKWAGAF